jgi:putative spermidine/putrescine transport system substrate-binding protein
MTPVSRRALVGAAAGLAVLPSQGWAQAGGPFVVNTYGGRWEAFWRSDLLPRLQPLLKRDVKLDIGLGGAWVTNFRAAGVNTPPFSNLMTNERYAVLLRQEGFFAPLPAAKIPNLADVYPVARYPGDVAVTGMVSPIGIAYRNDMIKTPPKSWRDLWNPEYKGQLGFYSAGNSLAPMLLMMAGKLFGSGYTDLDTGFRKIAELKPFPQVSFSGAMSPLMAQGQVAIAPIDFAEAVSLQQKGVPVTTVVPEDGVLMYDQAFNLSAHTADTDAACSYINFMLDPAIQLMLAREFFVTPVNRKVTVPADLHAAIPVYGDAISGIVTFDWGFVAKNSQMIADRWAKEI